MTTVPEADCHANAPHPRLTGRLFGQDTAQGDFLEAWRGGRLHHGWLITGPRGTGKATLAWRIARALLAHGRDDPAPESLDVAGDHPVRRRMAALSEPRLFLLRRGWDDKEKRLRQQITVDETRALRSFLTMSSADGGRRAVIVDSADDLNPNAANAILKMLEEPPAGVVLLLVCHQPARILPTIRSRCRELRVRPLSPPDLAAALSQCGADAVADGADAPALAELAGGSVAAALDLSEGDGAAIYGRVLAVAGGAPGLDRAGAIALSALAGGRAATARRDILIRLIELLLFRLARTGAGLPPAREAAPGESAHLARLAPHSAAARDWAALQQALTARADAAIAVNLDPAGLILDMLLRIDETAAKILARP